MPTPARDTHLAPLDALLLDGDSDPARRAHVTLVLVLDVAVSVERLRQTFDEASHRVARMRQRVRTSPLTRARSWRIDPKFAIERHVRVAPEAPAQSLVKVLNHAAWRSTARMDPRHPLWDATVFPAGDDFCMAVVLRVHHAMADGVRLLRMLSLILDTQPDGAPARAAHPFRLVGPVATSIVEDLARDAAELVGRRQRQTQYLASASSALAWRPIGGMSEISAYLGSARRTFDVGDARPSRLLAKRSLERQLRIVEVPLTSVRSTASAIKATVNDVYLAALLGGVARYHEALGYEVGDVPLCFPINVAGPGVSPDGNHFSAAAIPGPATIHDPARRIRAVHRLVRARRAEVGRDALTRLAPAVWELPSAFTALGLAAYSQRVDIQASNIIGPSSPVHLSGSPVGRLLAFGPLPGIPIMALLVSYNGTCHIGLTIDPVAVTRPGLFVQCIEDELDAMIAIGAHDVGEL